MTKCCNCKSKTNKHWMLFDDNKNALIEKIMCKKCLEKLIVLTDL